VAKQKKTFVVQGWLPGLEKRIDTFTDAYSEAQAIRNVGIRDGLPSWAPKYLEAYEVPPNPPNKHGDSISPKSNQQQRLW